MSCVFTSDFVWSVLLPFVCRSEFFQIGVPRGGRLAIARSFQKQQCKQLCVSLAARAPLLPYGSGARDTRAGSRR